MSRSQLLTEITWFVFAAVLAALVILPIHSKVGDYPFVLPNFVYVVVAITLTRYLFLLHLSWLRDRFYLQGLVIVVLVPLIFWMVQAFNAFIIYFDENGPDVLVRHLDPGTASILDGYMHAEFRFFGVWAIMAAFVTPFRLIYNVWVRFRATA